MSLLSKNKYHSVQGGAVSRPHPTDSKAPLPAANRKHKTKNDLNPRMCLFTIEIVKKSLKTCKSQKKVVPLQPHIENNRM